MGIAGLLPGLGHGAKGQAMPRKPADVCGLAQRLSVADRGTHTRAPGSQCIRSLKALLVRPPTRCSVPWEVTDCRTQNRGAKFQEKVAGGGVDTQRAGAMEPQTGNQECLGYQLSRLSFLSPPALESLRGVRGLTTRVPWNSPGQESVAHSPKRPARDSWAQRILITSKKTEAI